MLGAENQFSELVLFLNTPYKILWFLGTECFVKHYYLHIFLSDAFGKKKKKTLTKRQIKNKGFFFCHFVIFSFSEAEHSPHQHQTKKKKKS